MTTATLEIRPVIDITRYRVLGAISSAHFLNDML